MNKWTIIHIHSTPVFYVETQSRRKPQNGFSYMYWRITFLGSTKFLCFPTAIGRRLQPPSFLGYNLREALTPQFSGYNPQCSSATTTCPCPILPPWSRSRMMEPLSHYYCEIYWCKPVAINMYQTTCTNNLDHASTCTSTYTINKCINHALTCTSTCTMNKCINHAPNLYK